VVAVVASTERGKLIMADIAKGTAKAPELRAEPLSSREAVAAPLRATADDAAFFEFARQMESRLQEHTVVGTAAPKSEPVPTAQAAAPQPVGQDAAGHLAFGAAFPGLTQKIQVSWGATETAAPVVAERPVAPAANPRLSIDEGRSPPDLREPVEEMTAFDLNRLERFGTRKANARWTRNLTTIGVGAAALAAIWAALPDTATKAPDGRPSAPAIAAGSASPAGAGSIASSEPPPARPIRVVPLVPGASPARDGSTATSAAVPDTAPSVQGTSLAALPDLPAIPVATPGEDAASPTPAAKAPALPSAPPPVLPTTASPPPVTAAPSASKVAVPDKARLARPPKTASPDGTKHARVAPAKPVARTASGRPPGDDNGQATNVSAESAITRPPGLVTGQKPNADKGFDPFFIPKFIGRLFTDR
jgi:hypothetical protein